MSKEEQKKVLKDLGSKIVHQIKKGKNPEIVFPLRNLSNIVYDQKSKTLKLGNKTGTRSFFNVAHSKKFLQTIEVASVIKDKLLESGKHSSLRDVFYMVKKTIPGTKVNLVDDQTESDKAIEDLEVMTSLSREQMHVNANKNGSIAGKVIIVDKGDTIDWSKLGSGGWAIPSNVEEITFKNVDAKYVLYMEKAAVWERLNEDKYWLKNDAIIIASQGQTTRGIRRLLQRLYEEHHLPIYVLCDGDIYGAYIYSVIKYGSIALAHASERLTIPGVKYVGITMDDIEKYDLKKHFITLDEKDYARIKQVAAYDWFKDNKEWQRQFKMMKEFKAKVEIQALSARGISFISEEYLPQKIKNKEFLD
ncbi:MAG: DNA topoisomerase VI subunit A [archaeon GW2011_AR17]|nr:MAG: DNA topoisomerase VI subunit A [archaeon GW2011_AR17]MBS3154328.1 DNA topoisomerase IV subunit A [Candidatus Woesearchaeota archaeon]HIH15266.1 DNA topoisomerase IV subunit A [Nanoarchaeota archaeon]HIH58579.1 DNA topoisomerase IV subunit A [Nanoarchaeota archaeon]HII13774.1 DNA topoisomerase IV subunit A [Nanoarchaeota archaeon]